uniref:Uncharacterized protein n=1 Tax=Vitis vinifera TaxID=29760 RepID=A5C022_VITVI|nr:hypothetical protein VITISV_017697 [Vitis vinifera]
MSLITNFLLLCLATELVIAWTLIVVLVIHAVPSWSCSHDEPIVVAESIYTGQFVCCSKKATLIVDNVLPLRSTPEGAEPVQPVRPVHQNFFPSGQPVGIRFGRFSRFIESAEPTMNPYGFLVVKQAEN